MSQACLPYMKIDNAGEGSIENDEASNAGPCIIHIGSFRALQSDQNQEGYVTDLQRDLLAILVLAFPEFLRLVAC